MVVTDSFSDGTESPLGAPWGNNGVEFLLSQAGGIVTPDSISADSSAYYGSSGIGADQYVQVKGTVSSTGGGGIGVGVYARAATGARTGYRLVGDHAASNNFELARIVAGVFTSLATRTVSWADGQVIRLEVSGVGATVTLKIFVNGVQLGADVLDTHVTDRIVAAGNPGLAYSSTAASASLDDFEAGDLVAGNSISVFLEEPIIGGSVF